MNDYEFGNRLYELRTRAKLSQNELAEKLGVTGKAVSKWETGKAKPNFDTLNKLALLFKVEVTELLKKEKEVEITKIVITGGPCAGKSTALSWIQNYFIDLGYEVIFISETASEVINGGISFRNYDCLDFQECIMSLQLAKEEIYYKAALKSKKKKVLIVCDRGTLDSKAYLNELDFQNLLRTTGTSEVILRDNYDAVFHLVTAAKGAKEFYTLENNRARSESVEEAIKKDELVLNAYVGHPHLRVIDNSTDFENKMKRLINEISSFLGEPNHYEIERKYLIEYPSIKLLESLDNCKKIEIVQTYLKSNDDEEIRIRQRGNDGEYVYYKTIKKRIDGLKRVEIESRLSQEEYLRLLVNQDSNYRQIKKDRYCLSYKGTYYEIDVFPFSNSKAIMEVELKDENEKIQFPKFIKVIKEVTYDEEFKNHSLAKIKEGQKLPF